MTRQFFISVNLKRKFEPDFINFPDCWLHVLKDERDGKTEKTFVMQRIEMKKENVKTHGSFGLVEKISPVYYHTICVLM